MRLVLMLGVALAAYAQPPAIDRVVDAAAFKPLLAPSGLAMITGTGFTDGATYDGSSSFPWPKVLGETSVLIDGTPVPLSYARPDQINISLPASLGIGAHTLLVRRGTTSATTGIVLQATAPQVFQYWGLWDGMAITQNGQYERLAPAPTGVPAKPNDLIILYSTGFGLPTRTQNGLGIIDGTQAFLVNDDGTRKPIETFGTFDIAGLYYSTNVRLPANTPTGVTTITICAGDVCADPVGIPVWDGKGQYVNTYFWDSEAGKAFTGGLLNVSGTFVSPKNGAYVGNVPNDSSLELRINSTTHYNFSETVKPTGNSVKNQPENMIQRFSDPVNHYDRLDMVKKMNGANSRGSDCGAAYVYRWAQFPVDIYFADSRSVDPAAESMMEEAVLSSEQLLGYQPGTMLRKVTQDPAVTGNPGIRVLYNKGSSESVAGTQNENCHTPRQAEQWYSLTPSVDLLSFPDSKARVATVFAHGIFGHIMGYGLSNPALGDLIHSPYANENMYFTPVKAPTATEQRQSHLINSLFPWTIWSNYSQ